MSNRAPGHGPVDEHQEPWGASLRRSRERRVVAARRRRLRLRGRAGALALCGAMALTGGAAALAQTTSTASHHRHWVMKGISVRAVQRAVGVTADGAYGPVTRRAVKRFQRRHGLEVDGIVGPQTAAALGLTPHRANRRHLSRGIRAELHKIAMCESGGDPRAVSASGTYRGKYQFDRATWRSLGGHGDPAAAPERRQDRLAAKLLRQSGGSAWPNCA
jgi:hypothetical protein